MSTLMLDEAALCSFLRTLRNVDSELFVCNTRTFALISRYFQAGLDDRLISLSGVQMLEVNL
jgi:hypothetical protein